MTQRKSEYTADIFLEPKVCKECKAQIRWIKTKNLKWMPVDPKLTTIITLEGETIGGYSPHWATCPNANSFRKKGKTK